MVAVMKLHLLGRRREEPPQLQNFRSTLISDGYQAYTKAVKQSNQQDKYHPCNLLGTFKALF
ncbi:MAG: hypothetical protein ACI86X_000482 [Moritella sp.]|jgi:hypothetical protein